MMKFADRIILRASTSALVDGFSQRKFLIQQRIGTEGSFTVLHNGSISGVNPIRFAPNQVRRSEMRSSLGIRNDVFTVIFLGRLTRDKGITDLVAAFLLLEISSDSVLLLVGADEDGLAKSIERRITAERRRVLHIPETNRPEEYLLASDVMCLPSMREGFGTSVIEASAVGLPVVVSDVYGLQDAMIPDRTGVSFPAGNIGALHMALHSLAVSPPLRLRLGQQGKDFVRANFAQEDVVSAFESLLDTQISMLASASGRTES